MVTVAQTVKPLVNEHDLVHWKVGIVKSVDAGHKLTVQFVGATAGTGTPGCNYVNNYTPAVGHIVHCITAENRGILVLGNTGAGTPVLLDEGAAAQSTAPAEPEVPDASSVPERSGTFVTTTDRKIQFVPGRISQGPGEMGVWSFDRMPAAISAIRSSGLIVHFELELTLISGGPGAVLALIGAVNGIPSMVQPVRRVATLPLGVPTRVALPLGWLDGLEANTATIGLSNTSMTARASFDLSASVYLTIETV